MTFFCKLILICAVILPFCEIHCAAGAESGVSLMRNTSVVLLDDDCYFLLESFANASAKFTYCVIRSARPIMICQDCVEAYVLSVEVHRDILKLLDRAGELCKQKLLNLDRLQIVEGGFGYIYNLWKRAKCDSCYEMESEDRPEVLKKEILEILSLKNETDTCIQNHRNETADGRHVTDPKVCYDCKQQYLKLNAYYNSLEVASPMCMDIIDMMNTTRKVWSVDLGCCLDRKNPEYVFLVSSGIISVLPVLFYLLACSFTGKKEHQVVLLRNRCSIPYTGYVPMPVPAAATENLPASCSSTSAQINDNI